MLQAVSSTTSPYSESLPLKQTLPPALGADTHLHQNPVFTVLVSSKMSVAIKI